MATTTPKKKNILFADVEKAANKLGLDQGAVNMFAKAQNIAVPKEKTPAAPKTSIVDPNLIVSDAGSKIDPATGLPYQPGYAVRKAPTVATPDNPVIDKTVKQGALTFDPENPQDFIFKARAAQAAGTKLTQDDFYNIQVAADAIAKKQAETKTVDANGVPVTGMVDPNQAFIDARNKELEQIKAGNANDNQAAIQAKQRELDAKYANLIAAQERAGQRQADAAQTSTSFSGFGRSTFNADQQVRIAESTANALTELENQKQLELQAYQAELEGADAKALEPIYEALQAARDASTKWQLDTIAKTNEINKETGADINEAITNLLESATAAGMDLQPEDASKLEAIAGAVAGMSKEQKDIYLKEFSPAERALIEGAAAASGEVLTKDFGTAKKPDWRQSSDGGKTWTSMPGFGGGGSGGGGSGGGGFGGGNGAAASSKEIRTNDSILSLLNVGMASRKLAASGGIGAFLDPTGTVQSIKGNYDWIKNQLMLGDFVQLKKQGATFGAMSEAEWEAIRSAATKLNYNMSDADWKKELKVIQSNLSQAAQRAKINLQGEVVDVNTPDTATPPPVTPTAPNPNVTINAEKVSKFSKDALAAGASQADIKAYITQNPQQFR